MGQAERFDPLIVPTHVGVTVDSEIVEDQEEIVPTHVGVNR